MYRNGLTNQLMAVLLNKIHEQYFRIIHRQSAHHNIYLNWLLFHVGNILELFCETGRTLPPYLAGVIIIFR